MIPTDRYTCECHQWRSCQSLLQIYWYFHSRSYQQKSINSQNTCNHKI